MILKLPFSLRKKKCKPAQVQEQLVDQDGKLVGQKGQDQEIINMGFSEAISIQEQWEQTLKEAVSSFHGKL